MARVQLIDGATATNSAPTAATDGVAVANGNPGYDLGGANRAIVAVVSTAGSDTMTVTIDLWGYLDGSDYGTASWFKIGTLNNGPITEVTTDKLAHEEVVDNIRGFKRFHAHITAIGGTATAVDVYMQGAE